MGFADSTGWATSTFVTLILGIIVAASVVGITASFFGRSPSESYIIGVATLFGGTGLLMVFLFDISGIVTYLYSSYPDMLWLGNIFSVLFFSISAGYVIALIQFWRGNDI